MPRLSLKQVPLKLRQLAQKSLPHSFFPTKRISGSVWIPWPFLRKNDYDASSLVAHAHTSLPKTGEVLKILVLAFVLSGLAHTYYSSGLSLFGLVCNEVDRLVRIGIELLRLQCWWVVISANAGCWDSVRGGYKASQ